MVRLSYSPSILTYTRTKNKMPESEFDDDFLKDIFEEEKPKNILYTVSASEIEEAKNRINKRMRESEIMGGFIDDDEFDESFAE